jgi:perosamine synthetase
MNRVRLIKPYISYEDVEASFREVFESGIFTRGKNVDAFRAELVAYTGVPHVHLATSATTALWMCLKLLGIGPGDEVVVSDFSFPATANVVEDLGARPVFADVSLDTFNMLPQALEAAITERTRAVIFVDALGNPSGVTAIQDICTRRGIPLIEDAACAIGSSEHGRPCGSIADLSCFSFHPRKLISTGEGGAITTRRDDWARWFDIKLAHGASGMKGPGLDFVDYGYNFRLPELQAIMGRKQLAEIGAIVDERNAIRDDMSAQLAPLGFVAQALGEGVRYNVQSLVFRTPEGVDRDGLIKRLAELGVESTLGTYAMSEGSYFANKYQSVQPNSSHLQHHTLCLPCYRGLDVDQVTQAVRRAL